MILPVGPLILCLLLANTSLGQDGGGVYYDDTEIGDESVISPAEKAALGDVSAIYAELGDIRSNGSSREQIAQHRIYRLVPTLRDVARKAGELSSTALLEKAVELASCESEPDRSYEWMDVLTKAANKFSEREFQMAVEKLPTSNKRSLKAAMSANMPESFKWKSAVEKIPLESEYGAEAVEE